jgi:hypothetical protein
VSNNGGDDGLFRGYSDIRSDLMRSYVNNPVQFPHKNSFGSDLRRKNNNLNNSETDIFMKQNSAASYLSDGKSSIVKTGFFESL